MRELFRTRRWARSLVFALGAFILSGMLVPSTALAGNTGNITGTVTDASGKPLADVQVTASSPSQTASSTTDVHGFFSILDLIPDTYTVSFQKQGYGASSVPGIVVAQDQTQRLTQQMQPQLKTIASVHASGSSNLVKPNEGSDVYTVSGAQLTAATNPVNTLETIYQWMAITPGVTATIGSQPRIRGGQVTDLGYEFEGIPIQDRIVGFFTTNVSNTGLSNVELYTGGLAGAGAVNGTGYFNSVLKTGTYPGFESLSYTASSPEQNQYLSFERGWASANHRFSYYVGFSGVNSANQYDYGEYSFPGVVFPFCYCDGPGPVKERNWVGNFHYHPDAKNDFQVVATNDLGDFNFNYFLSRAPGEPLPLAVSACPGAVPAFGANGTYATGGKAANGQTCPLGIQWSPLGNGQGNIWHHLGGLGKIQWNHDFSDHESLNFRIAENFNQYIFDQPMADPNIPSLENPGDPFSWSTNVLGATCPLYPYAAGTPVQVPNGDPYDLCMSGDGIQVFWGNRRSNIWQAAADYTNVLNEHVTLRAGVSQEMDHNTFEYYDTAAYTTPPSGALIYPSITEQANYPTNQQVAYFNPDIHIGKLMLSPGATYAQRHYGFPADQLYATGNGVCPKGVTCNVYSGGYTAHTLDPTFNGTYSFDANDDVKFSWGMTTSFIASAYVYTSALAAFTGFDQGNTARNPFLPGTSFQPQLNHAAEVLYEHNFGNNTTMRIGPYYNKTTNYYNQYQPFLGFFQSAPTPCNPLNISSCIPCSFVPGGTCKPVFAKTPILTNNGEHNTMGAEFALNHINNAPLGTSWWLSATYDNYWTTSTSLSTAYINFPLPSYLIDKGIRVRNYANPLFSGTVLADFHSNGFHFDPLVYYQGDTFFYPTGTPLCANPKTGLYDICQQGIAHGWWWTKLNVYKDFGTKPTITLGFTVSNLFDNTTDTTPCVNGDPYYAPWNGTGCWPFDGPNSGVIGPPGGLIYQNYSQTPRTFYFYAGVKM